MTNERIYIECGAHNGALVRDRAREGIDDVIHAFEPCGPCWHSRYWAKIRNRYPQVYMYAAAVWVFDGELPFFINPERPDSESGTLLQTKTSGGVDTAVPAYTVPCIDFSAWLKGSARPDDRVHLHMDIEGAEYVVLAHLIDTGAIALVDELDIEFHAGKLADPQAQARHDALVDELDRVDGLRVTVAAH